MISRIIIANATKRILVEQSPARPFLVVIIGDVMIILVVFFHPCAISRDSLRHDRIERALFLSHPARDRRSVRFVGKDDFYPAGTAISELVTEPEQLSILTCTTSPLLGRVGEHVRPVGTEVLFEEGFLIRIPFVSEMLWSLIPTPAVG